MVHTTGNGLGREDLRSKDHGETWIGKSDLRIALTTHREGVDVIYQSAGSETTHSSAGLTIEGIGGARGHFIVRKAPEESIERLNIFVDRLGVAWPGYRSDPCLYLKAFLQRTVDEE